MLISSMCGWLYPTDENLDLDFLIYLKDYHYNNSSWLTGEIYKLHGPSLNTLTVLF